MGPLHKQWRPLFFHLVASDSFRSCLTGAFPNPGIRSDLPVFLLTGIMYLSLRGLSLHSIPLTKVSHIPEPDASEAGKSEGNEWL